jgi:Cytochrome c7 and related cytochrome c
VHPASLPRTCGTCHQGPYTQFQKSRHANLLAQKNYNAPTCSTCHGYAAAYTLSPNGLEKQCNACHGPGRKSARPGRAADARDWLQNIRDVRKLLDSAQPLIKRTKDAALRASLEYAYQQAQVPLTEAVHDGHAFVFTSARERLDLARVRATALLDHFSNGPGR